MHVSDGVPHRFPAALAAELRRTLPHLDTAPRSIDAADRAQGELLAIFEKHGHLAGSFLRVYHGITAAVLAALDRGELGPRSFFERLAGRFAEKHFDGVKAAIGLDTTTDAARYRLWEPSFAFDDAAPRPIVPIAHFLVGMSCHINLDLAVSLAETIREQGHARDRMMIDAIERGHDFVDTILAREVSSSLGALADQHGCPLSKLIVRRNLEPLVGRAAMELIRPWRARTFPAARALLAAPSDAARRHLRARIYRDGLRTTDELFELLPRLNRLAEPTRGWVRQGLGMLDVAWKLQRLAA